MTELLYISIGLYFISCVALYFFQDKLIFFPPEPVEDIYQSVKQNEVILNINNEQAHGWKVDVDPLQNKTLIYFGGNAEDVVYINFEAKEFKIKQCFTFNHPGYGKSSGLPSQQSFYKSALDIYDLIIREYQLNSEEVIVVGRSLGSSVATYLAANRKVAGVILITPFDSIKNLAKNKYKIFPVQYLVKHPFPTIDFIDEINAPILMLAAAEDELIADKNLQNLNQLAGDNSRLIRYTGVGHNTIQNHNNYYNEINQFIKREYLTNM